MKNYERRFYYENQIRTRRNYFIKIKGGER